MSDGGEGLSLYSQGEITEECLLVSQIKLKAAFPRMSDNFFNLLTERLIECGFSDKKLTDAINHLIDNFQYKELNISDVIRYDKSKKLYSHNEYCDMLYNHIAKKEDFEVVRINNNPYWVLKRDKYM